MQTEEENKIVIEDPPPPFLKTWNKLYALVFTNLIILVFLFYIFTKVFE